MKKIYSILLILIVATGCQNAQEHKSPEKGTVVEIVSAMREGTKAMTPIIAGDV